MTRLASSVLNVEAKYYRKTLLHTYWSKHYQNPANVVWIILHKNPTNALIYENTILFTLKHSYKFQL